MILHMGEPQELARVYGCCDIREPAVELEILAVEPSLVPDHAATRRPRRPCDGQTPSHVLMEHYVIPEVLLGTVETS